MNYIWKIKYDTLAIMQDGHIGNVSQGEGVAFIDCEFEQIERHLKEHLKAKKKFPILKEVIKTAGEIVVVHPEPVEYKPGM